MCERNRKKSEFEKAGTVIHGGEKETERKVSMASAVFMGFVRKTERKVIVQGAVGYKMCEKETEIKASLKRRVQRKRVRERNRKKSECGMALRFVKCVRKKEKR